MISIWFVPWKTLCSMLRHSAASSRTSFRRGPELLDKRPPFLGIGLYQRAERLWCLQFARENIQSEIGETRSHGRIGQRLPGSRIELGDDVLRRAPGREEPVPSRVRKQRQSHLSKGRDFGCCRQPSVACYGKRFYDPAAHVRQLNGYVNIQVDLAGYQVLDSRGAATVGHHGKMGPGFFLKEHSVDARTSGDAGSGRLVGIGLQPCDQFVHVLRRYRFPCKKNKRSL